MGKVDLTQLVGMRTEPRYMEYNWRDIALYALAVGAKAEDLQYTSDNNSDYLQKARKYGHFTGYKN